MRTRRAASAALALATVLAVGACSTRAQDDGGGGGGGEGGGDGSEVTTDIGVTEDTITLGILTDFTGPFASLSQAITQGNQLVYNNINDDGGICGRQVELEIQDHGYDVQRAVQLYNTVAPNVLGFTQLIGSPMVTELLDQISADEVMVAPASWASNLLENPYILMGGTTYDLESINSVQYALDNGLIAEGDTIGSIYVEGEYGANGLLGVQYAADELGLNLVAQQVKSTDTDLSSAVAALRQEGVTAVFLTTTPAQTASAVGTAAGAGLNVPFFGNNPTFAPAILDTPAGPALEANFYLAASVAPYASEGDMVAQVREEYAAEYPDGSPNGGTIYGYGVATIFASVLQRACDNGDLTRAGVQEALTQTDNGDTGGLIAPLDYSTPGASPSREIYLARPDSSVEGGLVLAEPELFTTDLAQGYVGPAEN